MYLFLSLSLSLLLLSSLVCFSLLKRRLKNYHQKKLKQKTFCSRSTQVISRACVFSSSSSSSSGPSGLQCVGQSGLTVAATTKRECVCVRVNRIFFRFSSFSLEHHHCQPFCLYLSLFFSIASPSLFLVRVCV